MINLPIEVIRLIYEFDGTYRDVYNDVVDELKDYKYILQGAIELGHVITTVKADDEFIETNIGRVQVLDDYDELDDHWVKCLNNPKHAETIANELPDYSLSEVKAMQKLNDHLFVRVLRDIMQDKIDDYYDLLSSVSDISVYEELEMGGIFVIYYE